MTQDGIIEVLQSCYDALDVASVSKMETVQSAQPTSQDVLDAERYRWLKPNYAMANFDIYDAEKGESKQSGIIFEMPDGLSYGEDLDALIDAAMKESK